MPKRRYSDPVSYYSPRYPVRLIESWNSPYSPPNRRMSVPVPMSPINLPKSQILAYESSFDLPSGVGPSRSTQYSRPLTGVVRKARISQRAYLAGKVRAKKKVSRKLSYRKKRGKGKGKVMKTRLGMSSVGVHVSEEHRFVSKTDMVEGDRYEAVQVGHTSIPQKTVLLNMCRALLKYSLKKATYIKDFTTLVTDNAAGSAFQLGDTFRWTFYGNWDSNTVNNFTVTFNATDTYEHVARNLMNQIITYADAGNLNNLRWIQFEYDPVDSGVGNKYPWFIVPLQNLSVQLETKSSLKLQNRTVNIVGVEDDANDVDNVPLIGYLYNCKGNNFLHKTQRSIMKGIDSSLSGGSVNTKNNDIILFEGTKREIASLQGGTGVTGDAIFGSYSASESSFFKPAEPPKPYQVVNCKKASKIRINPGGIKTSVLTAKTKTGFSYMLSLLAGDNDGVALTKQKYSSKLGYCNVMYLEKVIGSKTSPVACAAEVQFDCWISVSAKGDVNYTNTVQLQQDYGTYP